jgi:transcriptional accessory protein Tex/SPT6
MPREVKSRWTRRTPPTVGFRLDREERLATERAEREQIQRASVAFLRSLAGTPRSLRGLVERVESYGAFVVGSWGKGLVHISRMHRRHVRDAREIVELGQLVTVWVVEVDAKDRAALTMIGPGPTDPIASRPPLLAPPARRETSEPSEAVEAKAEEMTFPQEARAGKKPIRSFKELSSFLRQRDRPPR